MSNAKVFAMQDGPIASQKQLITKIYMLLIHVKKTPTDLHFNHIDKMSMQSKLDILDNTGQ